jgi:hypothetical protein
MKYPLPTNELPGLAARFRLAASALVAAVFIVACTSAPTQEMSDARQAVFSARDADAPDLAPRSMDSAEQLLDRAQRFLKQGRYDVARNDALEARQAAMKARQVAVAITEARVAVEDAKAKGKGKGKGSAWLSAESLIDEAQAAGQQGNESRAWELAMEAKRLVQ